MEEWAAVCQTSLETNHLENDAANVLAGICADATADVALRLQSHHRISTPLLLCVALSDSC